jgi:hypothetical protein
MNDHFVQLYDDTARLADAVAQYAQAGLRRGEAVVLIATPEHRRAFLRKLDGAERALGEGRLRVLDAERTLERFMASGMPQWKAFHEIAGGLIAELRLRYPAVRAYGEMVDVLWQRGEREAAIRLEEYWNELGRLQAFSLFCAYRLSPLDAASYGGPLESVCRTHTHLIPHHDVQGFDEAVRTASAKTLDPPLAELLLSLATRHRQGTEMPLGQVALFWLKQNMPRTAEKVLSEVRATISPAG